MRNFPDSDQWHLLKLLKLVIAASEPIRRTAQSSALWMSAVRRFGLVMPDLIRYRDDDDFGLKLSTIADSDATAAELSYS